MIIAVVGSRTLTDINLELYLPEEISQIVSGGAKGVDSCAKDFAREHNLIYKEFLPEYGRYSRAAPLKRNEKIADYADVVYIFWDGQSRGTRYMIDYCSKTGKSMKLFIMKNS